MNFVLLSILFKLFKYFPFGSKRSVKVCKYSQNASVEIRYTTQIANLLLIRSIWLLYFGIYFQEG